jgi:hypothetical protein
MSDRSETAKTKKNTIETLWSKARPQILNFDRFAKPMQINFNGKTELPTFPGFYVTLLMTAITLLFAF